MDDIVSIEKHEGFETLLGKPESLLHLPRFLQTPGITGTALAAELHEFIPPEGPIMSRSAWFSDTARKLKDFLGGIQVLGQEQSWLPFEVQILFCPPVEGAKATLKTTIEKESKASCKIEIFGLGGGSDFTIRLRQSSKLEVHREKIAEIYHVLATWDHCELLDRNGKRIRFPRISALHRNYERIETRGDTPGQPDPSWGAVAGVSEFDLRKAPTALSRGLEIETGMQWKTSSTVKLSNIDLSFGMEYIITRQQKMEYEYTLAPGYFYRALRFENAGHWWWERS